MTTIGIITEILAACAFGASIMLAYQIGKLYTRLEKLEAGVTRLELEGIYKNEIDYGRTSKG